MPAINRLESHRFRLISRSTAEQIYADLRYGIGLANNVGSWLTPPTGNLKFEHTGERHTYGLSLLPAREAITLARSLDLSRMYVEALSDFNVCVWSTILCREACLADSGKGTMLNSKMGRLARTLLWAIDPDAAYTLTHHHINEAIKRHGVNKVAVRLNVFSDITWETVLPDVFWQTFHDVQFYDYTKAPIGKRIVPPNYHLTYSASEQWTPVQIRQAVEAGHNVAVVINQPTTARKPLTWNGCLTADGNKTDARYLDGEGVVVLLGTIGHAKKQDVGIDRFVKPRYIRPDTGTSR